MDTSVQPARDGSTAPLDGVAWRRSSYSGTQGNCVEVATNVPGIVAVRDSKDPDGPVLVVSVDEWREFMHDVREGQFEA